VFTVDCWDGRRHRCSHCSACVGPWEFTPLRSESADRRSRLPREPTTAVATLVAAACVTPRIDPHARGQRALRPPWCACRGRERARCPSAWAAISDGRHTARALRNSPPRKALGSPAVTHPGSQPPLASHQRPAHAAPGSRGRSQAPRPRWCATGSPLSPLPATRLPLPRPPAREALPRAQSAARAHKLPVTASRDPCVQALLCAGRCTGIGRCPCAETRVPRCRDPSSVRKLTSAREPGARSLAARALRCSVFWRLPNPAHDSGRRPASLSPLREPHETAPPARLDTPTCMCCCAR